MLDYLASECGRDIEEVESAGCYVGSSVVLELDCYIDE